jgi:transposase InsO family protein
LLQGAFTRVLVWWLRLGIDLERIRPGHPEQNGRHERMHLTLKMEATKPAAKNSLQQVHVRQPLTLQPIEALR